MIWNPLSYAVVYGRSLSAYCVVQGLLLRQVAAADASAAQQRAVVFRTFEGASRCIYSQVF